MTAASYPGISTNGGEMLNTMKASRIILINVLAFAIIIGLGLGGYYYLNQQWTYVTTDDAQVTGTLVPVATTAPGTLTDWRGTDGQTFAQGDVVGQVVSPAGATDITAPISGTVIQNQAVGEESVVPGVPLATIVDLRHLYIVANIAETQIRNVNVGDDVDVSVDADPGTTFKGKVTQIGLATNALFSLLPQNNASGDYTKTVQRIPVTVSLIGYPNDFVPGMNATVRIHRQS